MFKILQKTVSTGIVTVAYPRRARSGLRRISRPAGVRLRDLARRAAGGRGLPHRRHRAERRRRRRRVTVDYGRCIFCGECADASPDGAVRITTEFELATHDRASLISRRSTA